ncbi:hypothetical protein Tco_1118864 [Tanacetum coccineum]
MQEEEQEKLSIKEKSKLFLQLIEARKKHFATMRAQEKRNKPPTKSQKRNTMSTYLKNMAGYKQNQLKNKSFNDIQNETRIEGSSKRAEQELEQESIKKKKVDEDKETAELQRLIEIVPDKEEVALDAIPLAVKSPSIIDWKIHKEGRKSYYQIIRADGSLKMYLLFSHMLKSFDKEDLVTLYKLVKAKYGLTRPVEDLDLVLYGDLKTMFEPHVEDNVWKNQSDYRVLDWKLYDSCDLKNKSFDSIQKMFDRAFKRVNTFVDFRTDLVEGSSKRAGEKLEQESSKKQKVDNDKETAELKSLMEVIPGEEEVALDAIPLAVKSLSIIDWKIHKEGKKSYYQIIRADGSSKMYLVFSHMLKSFDREDLETLYKLVKAKYGLTRPVEDLDLVLYGDLKTMFEPHVEDNVWKNQSDYKVFVTSCT